MRDWPGKGFRVSLMEVQTETQSPEKHLELCFAQGSPQLHVHATFEQMRKYVV